MRFLDQVEGDENEKDEGESGEKEWIVFGAKKAIETCKRGTAVGGMTMTNNEDD